MAALSDAAVKSLDSFSKATMRPLVELSSKTGFTCVTNPWSRRSLTWNASLEGNGSIRISASRLSGSTDASLVSDAGVSYEKLQHLLGNGEWELADEETRRLLIVLAGENAVKRKYVFFSEVQFIPKADLQAIDSLWRSYSQNKFGYSIQRKILKRMEGDFTAFFKKVGWMKPLGPEDSLQYTYCSFPTEFKWELAPSTPEGHLPLTNALRGTQLLKSVLDHPAFEFADEELQAPSGSSSSGFMNGSATRTQQPLLQPKKPLFINYSF